MAKIMLQGTSSSVGKSMMTLALCRIFTNMGLRVAPFKAQNMSSKFYKLENGDVISTAQLLQAKGAKIEPNVKMNPILLVPKTDMGSEVFVEGKSVGTMQAREYFKYKSKLFPVVREAFESLEKENDLVVIEGAGSAAEINLKENDLVNMGMAEIADSDVIIVSDIDRGGVFASLYGTVMLLESDERRRIKGFIINKFRGDKALLEPGIEMIEQMTGIKVLGVIPYAHLEIPDEDSLLDYKKECNDSEQSGELLDKEIERFSQIVLDNIDIKAVCEIAGIKNEYDI